MPGPQLLMHTLPPLLLSMQAAPAGQTPVRLHRAVQ